MNHFIILGIIVAALLLFAFEVVRPDIVAIGVTLTLLLLGIVDISEGFSGFSNPAVITVICMFILSAGLIRTGVADFVAGAVLRVGGKRPVLLIPAVMVLVGVMSAFMNNIGAVAVLLPTMFVISRKSGLPANRLLIPLSFGSLMGGLATLIGTPPNLLVSMALEDQGFEPFRLFDFAPTGLAVMAVGVLYMTFIGRHLIPVRDGEADLTQQFQLENYLTEVVVPPGSDLAGKTIEQSRIGPDLGLTVLRVLRPGQRAVSGIPLPTTRLEAGDHLIVEGSVAELVRSKGKGLLDIAAEKKFTDEALADEKVELAEAVVAPNGGLLGRSIKGIDVRHRFDVLVLALKQRGRPVQEGFASVPLAVGDVLLIQGSPKAIASVAASPDFVVVNRLEHEPRVLKKAPVALAIMAAAILSAAYGVLHISVAGIMGVLLMAITGCVSIQRMYDAVEWRVIFLIACMMPLGIAMDSAHVGTAEWLAGWVVFWTGDYGPHVVMGSLFIFTTLITEVMSNAAAAVLLGPIGVAIAVGMAVDPHPFMMAIAIGASTTFLTPIGHQANVLVYGVGNYRFTDFGRVGALLNLLIFILAMLLIPIVWPFTPLGQ
jgi:di/tricarboxylate transporter